jgi:hypothetical protein
MPLLTRIKVTPSIVTHDEDVEEKEKDESIIIQGDVC